MLNIGRLAVTFIAKTAKFVAGVGIVNTKLESLRAKVATVTTSMLKMGTAMTLGITLPIILGLQSAIRAFSKFEEKMRNVNTIAKLSEDVLDMVTDKVIEMSRKFARVPNDMAEALYDINSATIKGQKSLDLLAISAKASVSGLTSVRTSARLFTGVINAYGKEVEEAGDLSDIAFRTIERGVLTFGQFAEHAGITIASASAAGIKFEEVAAAVATITRAGITAEKTFTSLNNAFLKLATGSKELNKIAAKYGYESSAAMVRGMGLLKTVMVLNKESGGTTEGMKKLGFRIRGLRSMLSLARGGAQEFAKDMVLIGTEEGRAEAASRALAQQQEALAYQWGQLKNIAFEVGYRIGKIMKPALISLIKVLKEVGAWFIGLRWTTKALVLKIALLVAAIGPLLIAISLIGKAFLIATSATAVFLGTLGLLVAGMFAAVSTIKWFSRSAGEEVRTVFDVLPLGIQENLEKGMLYLSEFMIGVWDWGKKMVKIVSTIFIAIGKGIWAAIKGIGIMVGKFFANLADVIAHPSQWGDKKAFVFDFSALEEGLMDAAEGYLDGLNESDEMGFKFLPDPAALDLITKKYEDLRKKKEKAFDPPSPADWNKFADEIKALFDMPEPDEVSTSKKKSFSGAFEKGSVDAYSIAIRGGANKTETKIEENTRKQVFELQRNNMLMTKLTASWDSPTVKI